MARSWLEATPGQKHMAREGRKRLGVLVAEVGARVNARAPIKVQPRGGAAARAKQLKRTRIKANGAATSIQGRQAITPNWMDGKVGEH